MLIFAKIELKDLNPQFLTDKTLKNKQIILLHYFDSKTKKNKCNVAMDPRY